MELQELLSKRDELAYEMIEAKGKKLRELEEELIEIEEQLKDLGYEEKFTET